MVTSYLMLAARILDEDWQEEKHSRKPNGQFGKGTSINNRRQYKPVRKGAPSESYLIIPRSVGAKFSNYKVLDRSTGEVFYFAEGQKYMPIEKFAGAGTNKPLREEVKRGLSEQYGVKADEIAHCKVTGYLNYYGESVKADVHWFEVPGKKFKFYVKEWLFDED